MDLSYIFINGADVNVADAKAYAAQQDWVVIAHDKVPRGWMFLIDGSGSHWRQYLMDAADIADTEGMSL